MSVARSALTARQVLLASRVVCALASGASYRAPAPIRSLAAQPSLAPAVCKRPSSYVRLTCSAAATDGTMVETNPLLTDSPFPAYSEVKAEHVVPGIRALLAELHAEVDKLEASVEPTWEGLVQPLERIVDRLSRAWGTVSHLKAVKDTEELRKAVEEVQPERVKLSLRLSQSKPLYEAFKAIKEGPQWAQLTEAQQRIVDGELRDFVLGGVALEGEAKERFNEIQQELSQLSTKFSNNVLDATKAYKKLLTDKADVEGLPESALALAAQQAAKEGHEGATPESGPWLFTLDFPSYFPVMTHAKNRALREEMYRQSITRASAGDIDNTPIIDKVLALRQEKAELLGFKNFADVSMASKVGAGTAVPSVPAGVPTWRCHMQSA
jgi:oligopeptidase A